MSKTFTMTDLRRDVQKTLERLRFLAGDGAHEEGDLAAVEMISIPCGENACNLALEIRPYAIDSRVAADDKSMVCEVLDELSKHHDGRVRGAARLRRRWVEAPALAPEDLAGIELALVGDPEGGTIQTVTTGHRGQALFVQVPAAAACRLEMRPPAMTEPPMPAPPTPWFKLPPLQVYGASCHPAAAGWGKVRSSERDALPLVGQRDLGRGLLLWQVYRDDAERVVLGLRYQDRSLEVPAGVALEIRITETRTGREALRETVELARDHHGIWIGSIIVSDRIELTREHAVDLNVHTVAGPVRDRDRMQE
jgi:hypothetical protein